MQRFSPVLLALGAALAGCSGGASSIAGPELFTYAAATQVTSTSPMRFQTTMTVRNGTGTAIDFVPGCPIPRLLVYRTSAHTGAPFWDSNSRASACPIQATTTLAAGQSTTYTFTGSGAEVLGTTGTPGTYYLVAETTLSGVSTDVSAGQVNLTR